VRRQQHADLDAVRQRVLVTGDLIAGNSYALVCLTEDKKGELLTLYVATPLVPSG